ncbi:TPA: Ig-like domain-containing protein, partial [Klebsiella pneumoniae]
KTITHVNGTAITEGGAAVSVANGSVTLTGGKLVFTPTAGYTGPASFTYTANTPTGVAETANVNITVAANQPPVITDPSQPNGTDYSITTDEDKAISGQVNATDADGHTLTYTLVGQPANGSVELNSATGAYTFTPNADWNGNTSFQVTVSDGHGGSVTSTVNVAVKPEQDVLDDTATTGFDKPVTVDALANDHFEGAP